MIQPTRPAAPSPRHSLWQRGARVVAGALALLGVLLAPAAQAGEAERKTALELVRLVTPRQTHDAMMKQVMDQMIAAVQAQGAKLPPGTPDKIRLAVAELVS